MTDVLTRDLAQKRAKTISNLKYSLSINLKKSIKTYTGKCILTFFLSNKDEPLILDFTGNIKKLSINEKEASFGTFENKISISPENLSLGENKLEISYENEFDTTGDGLHKFDDPEDHSEYIYSNFEPYDAHRMFPCFDQPDLKAIYNLTVTSPKDWEVIANTPESVVDEKNETKTTTFKPTKPISTYLFHLSAGDYAKIEDNWGETPLRIFCRKTMKKYVKDKEIFTVTKQGLEFYSKFFDYKYPFDKYDQLFVPEFNSGAMENVGAITFTEKLIFRHEPTRTERLTLAEVILHEMVHMWFGDLVTMKWWDDLWLNESFADYLAYFGMVRATEFKEGMQDFSSRKSWAFTQDQLPTTHPVAADASDTDIAFANFDGISYAKGASIIKQMIFYLGEDIFKKGVQAYFKKYQWKNTELKDFITCMEEASGKNLQEWTRLWIQTSGINTIKPIYETKDGKIKSFSIKQYPGGNILRPHKTLVALFYCNENKCEKQKDVEFTFDKEENPIKELENEKKPDFICLDYNDDCYFKEILDRDSLEYVLNHYEQIKEGLTRQVILRSLWHMIKDAELDPKRYLDLVLAKGFQESNQVILERMFLNVFKILGYYLPDEEYYEYCQKFYDFGLEKIEDTSKENKNSWFRLIILSSLGAGDINKLIDILEGRLKIKDFKLNLEQRWSIVLSMAVRGNNKFSERLEVEKRRDPSDKGEKSAFRAETASLANKEENWKLFVSGKKFSTDYLRQGMSGFFWRPQKNDLEKYINEFFKVVKDIFLEKDRRYSEAFFNTLSPGLYHTQDIITKSEEIIKQEDAPFLLKKHLLELIDETKRTQKIIKKWQK